MAKETDIIKAAEKTIDTAVSNIQVVRKLVTFRNKALPPAKGEDSTGEGKPTDTIFSGGGLFNNNKSSDSDASTTTALQVLQDLQAAAEQVKAELQKQHQLQQQQTASISVGLGSKPSSSENDSN